MNSHYRIQHGSKHEQISALIPWHVNGTLNQLDRQEVESHLSTCAACREDMLRERSVYRNVAAETRVGYMPGSSLKRLNAALDRIGEEPPLHARPPLAEGPTRRYMPWHRPMPWYRLTPWRGLMAASVAVLAVATAALVANRWTSFRPSAPQSDYQTVTTPVAHPPGEVVRAVFAPAVTLVELQAILDESQLRIISGPTEAGVYSLAATSSRPVDLSLAILRQHATVRFAESTLPGTESHAPR